MTLQSRRAFLVLILAQAAHSTEEYVFRLFDVFAPARFVSSLLSDDLAVGFALVNAGPVLFGLWCYVARVRPAGHSSGTVFAWLWTCSSSATGSGTPLWRCHKVGTSQGSQRLLCCSGCQRIPPSRQADGTEARDLANEPQHNRHSRRLLDSIGTELDEPPPRLLRREALCAAPQTVERGVNGELVDVHDGTGNH